MGEKTDSFRMARKPGVERSDQIGNFGDMLTIHPGGWREWHFG